jgi:aspartyl/asparaginyl beta-hydroxylase (cupin superfamily)
MSAAFPVASRFCDELVRSQQGTMGRAVMAKLRPHGTVYPHTDDGLYWLLRDRYHLVLKSVAGSVLRAGGEEVRMKEGELWWFDPTVLHEALNDSDQDRIHVIVDVRSKQSLKSFRTRVARGPLRFARACYQTAIRRAVIGLRPH